MLGEGGIEGGVGKEALAHLFIRVDRGRIAPRPESPGERGVGGERQRCVHPARHHLRQARLVPRRPAHALKRLANDLGRVVIDARLDSQRVTFPVDGAGDDDTGPRLVGERPTRSPEPGQHRNGLHDRVAQDRAVGVDDDDVPDPGEVIRDLARDVGAIRVQRGIARLVLEGRDHDMIRAQYRGPPAGEPPQHCARLEWKREEAADHDDRQHGEGRESDARGPPPPRHPERRFSGDGLEFAEHRGGRGRSIRRRLRQAFVHQVGQRGGTA